MMWARTAFVKLDREVFKPDTSSRVWKVCTVVENIAALQYSR